MKDHLTEEQCFNIEEEEHCFIMEEEDCFNVVFFLFSFFRRRKARSLAFFAITIRHSTSRKKCKDCGLVELSYIDLAEFYLLLNRT